MMMREKSEYRHKLLLMHVQASVMGVCTELALTGVLSQM